MIIAVVALGVAAAAAPDPAARGVRVRFESGRTIRAEVADTPAARQKGLMFRKRLPRGYGMLFVFPGEYGMQFWMKNTWVGLDMVFIGGNKRITVVHERVSPSTPETSDAEVARASGLAQYVLELPAGAARRYRLKAGQPVDFEVPIPDR
ncbi:MAG: DUF192 domain-containing protein [Elusimicrobia bacterium]|nr:DUF192 domain-containing protein [Elusimicrobiota bacterium]